MVLLRDRPESGNKLQDSVSKYGPLYRDRPEDESFSDLHQVLLAYSMQGYYAYAEICEGKMEYVAYHISSHTSCTGKQLTSRTHKLDPVFKDWWPFTYKLYF